MSTDSLTLLRKRIRTRMNELADDMALGSATDFGQYQKMVGIVAGLAFAEMELLSVVKAVNESNGLENLDESP
ncbi:MAG: hypothetical protein JW395_1284 [Nitrospira sp.]|nr:hypothetical protein [Nitrospira sp.]